MCGTVCVLWSTCQQRPLNLLFICCSEKQFKETRNAACSCRATVACTSLASSAPHPPPPRIVQHSIPYAAAAASSKQQQTKQAGLLLLARPPCAHASPAACMQEEKAKPLCCCMRYKLGSCLKHQSLILGRFQSQHDEEEAQQRTLQARPRHDRVRSLQRLRLQAQEGQGSEAVYCQEYG